jgi:hypothetical protein
MSDPDILPSILQKHCAMSATEIFLVSVIENLSQDMRLRADMCKICGKRGNIHTIFSNPRSISVPHNTGLIPITRLPGHKDLGNRSLFFTGYMKCIMKIEMNFVKVLVHVLSIMLHSSRFMARRMTIKICVCYFALCDKRR